MRTRLLIHLLVLVVLLVGFAPDASARSTRDVGAGVPRLATRVWTGGAALAPRLGAPTIRQPDTPTVRLRSTQARSPLDAPAAPGDAPPGPRTSVSGTTTQTITQIQVAACSSHCRGTTETQAAQQQALTMQAVTGGRNPGQPNRPGRPLRLRTPSRHPTRITRGQIGCLAHCFGRTTRGLRLDGRRRPLRALLRALTGNEPVTPASAAGTAQSIVRQASDQRQHGVLPLKTQRQRSTQASSTIQSVRLSRKLIRNPQSATISAAPIESAVNQTVQRIWQLQIGCLSHCAHTVQYQQAKQTSTTVQQLVAPLATAAAAQDNTYQSIWQLQVGCLVWCFSATEQQRAASRHLTLSSPTAQSPPEVGRSGFVQLESTIASQSEEPGVGIVAGSVQASGVSALRSSGGRSHHRHVSVAHPPRRPRSSATVPQPSVVRSSVANRRTDSSYAVLGVVAGLIALLAMISASRVVPRRARR